MKLTSLFPLFTIAAMTLSLSSCEKEKFDKNAYNELVDFKFLIDNVDKEHNWSLTHSDTIIINSHTENIHTVQVLTKNPFSEDGAEIAAEGVCFLNEQNDGYTTTLAYTLPATQRQAFIAAKGRDGSYLGVRSFNVGTDTIDLGYAMTPPTGTLRAPKAQTFTYLYEEGFPLPGDFDFNDLVLRISKQTGTYSYQVDLKVTVEAVGAKKSYAGAILLAGVNYDEISKVEILDGEAMDKGYPMMRININSDKLLMKSRNGEAVINLFESGHYVMNQTLNSVGSVQTLFYNTETTPTEKTGATVPSVTRTYRINFKNRNSRLLTFDQIDPFIVQEYNGGLWEIHTYRYKFEETLHSIYGGKSDFYDNHISWAIVVPKQDFRWAIEGMSLGTYNSNTGETFGPYTSFADWMKDHTQNNDWYERVTYPRYLY